MKPVAVQARGRFTSPRHWSIQHLRAFADLATDRAIIEFRLRAAASVSKIRCDGDNEIPANFGSSGEIGMCRASIAFAILTAMTFATSGAPPAQAEAGAGIPALPGASSPIVAPGRRGRGPHSPPGAHW